MARLDVIYPQTVNDASATALRYQIFFDALADLSVNELKSAVDQWLRSEERFAPSPGQLLAVARPPYREAPHRQPRPAPGELIPPEPRDPAELDALLKRVYAETGFNPNYPPRELKPVVMTTELELRERDLRSEREANLRQRLAARARGDNVG